MRKRWLCSSLPSMAWTLFVLCACGGAEGVVVPFQCVISDSLNRPTVVFNSVAQAVQEFQFSLLQPNPDSVHVLNDGEPWSTDWIPLKAEVIRDHNVRYPEMALPGDRIYGIRYEGSYSAYDSNVQFSIHAILQARGVHSKYQLYDGEYSGRYFVQRLVPRLEHYLSANTGVERCEREPY